MTTIGFDELRKIMRQCAGEDESADLDAAFDTATFDELGYDSLALLETTSRVEQLYGVKLPEEELLEVTTPAEFIEFVNTRLRMKAPTGS
ncbi:acyl carrier protein [Nocardia asteroides]